MLDIPSWRAVRPVRPWLTGRRPGLFLVPWSARTILTSENLGGPLLCHQSRGQRDAKGVTLMGRGRQKAKATKQAREMKYFSPGTDLSALERELNGKRHHADTDEMEYEDPYADLYDDEDDEDGDDAR